LGSPGNRARPFFSKIDRYQLPCPACLADVEQEIGEMGEFVLAVAQKRANGARVEAEGPAAEVMAGGCCSRPSERGGSPRLVLEARWGSRSHGWGVSGVD
jgi:hypothetical protein